jgi:glycosyltransferase involved in cell wall biosynthesis
MPPNVHFLGLKPQTELPAYIQRFDVGIIPFKISDTTHAVSPLKAYEYLASGVPIAAPPLRALGGLDHVVSATDLVEAVRMALKAQPPDRKEAMREHSWTSRVLMLFPGGHETGDATQPSAAFRRVIHHDRPDRLIPQPQAERS